VRLREQSERRRRCWFGKSLIVHSHVLMLTSPLSSAPRRRPQPKDGAAAKPAPTAEEIAEWQKPLEECIKEVKELVS
jgi:hypothetical protein